MPTVPAPEPWHRPRKRESQKNDRFKDRESFYDANRKLVGFVIVREAEKDDKQRRFGARTRRNRIITCVNACEGLPDEVLNREGILQLAIQLMRRACDFGDLHLQTLPDRIEANMRDLYYATILQQRNATREPQPTL